MSLEYAVGYYGTFVAIGVIIIIIIAAIADLWLEEYNEWKSPDRLRGRKT